MGFSFFFFLSSGLFLGWSLGTNDAANVFGTAVGSRMLRFSTAATVCAIFVVFGAVMGGAGPSHGLGQLGSVNALGGSFTVALAAAITVFGMTKLCLPVSTTQAVVGGILGWNLFSATATDWTALSRIVGTWVACPILGALFALVLYHLVVWTIRKTKPHILWLDQWTRVGLVAAGALGAYSLGANNVANVVGVFVPASPFENVTIGGVFMLTGPEQLFLLGGLAIAVGGFFSRRVMMTVGNNIVTVGPVGGWVVVMAQSLVLFVFSSQSLQAFVVNLGLPRIPLVPVSSSQAVVGAVCGLALARGFKGVRQINWRMLRNIAIGWVATPVVAALISYVALYFVQNVFEQVVFV
jgi:PiT family inorganic phosphate transporter